MSKSPSPARARGDTVVCPRYRGSSRRTRPLGLPRPPGRDGRRARMRGDVRSLPEETSAQLRDDRGRAVRDAQGPHLAPHQERGAPVTWLAITGAHELLLRRLERRVATYRQGA